MLAIPILLFSRILYTQGGEGKKKNMSLAEALITTDLKGALPLVARGKVRDLYEVDENTLLIIATDRISAFDVVMENVRFPSSSPKA